jgi:transposase
MVGFPRRQGKASQFRFAAPLWDENHPRWRQLDEELPQDHVARGIVAAMKTLDLSPLYASYSGSGSPAIRPDLMLRMVLIEIHSGHHRPSQWFRNAKENSVLKWAGMGIQVRRTYCYEFSQRVQPFLSRWNEQIVNIALQKNITTGEQASLDGSAFAANASRHRLVNNDKLEKRMTQLNEVCAQDLSPNEESIPREPIPSWMAKTPSTRRVQLKRFERAKERLEELHALNQRQDRARRREAKKVVVSVSDPEAALGRDKLNVFRPLYNVQMVTDVKTRLILSYGVFAQATDAGTFKPMLQRLTSIVGLNLKALLVDAGYVTASNLALSCAAHVTLYGPWKENDYSRKTKPTSQETNVSITKDQFTWCPTTNEYLCPQQHPLTYIGTQNRQQADGEINQMLQYKCSASHCTGCPLADRCTTNPKRGRSVKRSEHEELIEEHRRRMETDDAKQLYKQRRQTVELGFADVKEHRGVRRFSSRGKEAATATIGLVVMTHNLLIVQRAIQSANKAHEEAVTCCKIGA